MQKITKILISLIIFLVLIMPVLSLAVDPPSASSLVPCNNTPDAKGVVAYPCGFTQLMDMVNKVIHFVLFDMVLPIAAIMFAYAGFSMITAGEESSSARTKAKNIFFNTIIGLAIAIAAWLIIRTILSILGYDGEWIGFPLHL